MGVISSDLIKFKDSVSPSLGSMQSASADLQSKLSSMTNITKTAKNGIDSFYNSDKKSSVLSSFDSLADSCNVVGECVSSELGGILSGCSALLNQIAKLEKINEEIEAQKNKAASTDDEAVKRAAQSVISQKNNEFTSLENEAKTALTSLKAAGASAPKGLDSVNATEKIADVPKGGSFKLEEINVNGTMMKCYVYRPYYDKDVGKLPVMLYMYGMDMDKNHGTDLMTNGGLGYLLQSGQVKPSGIVVIPYVQRGRLYESEAFRNQLAQLPIEVAKKYNGDVDRISLGGTSYGAVTAYRLVQEHPEEFSALVAAYGAGEITDAFRGMRVFNYTGRGGETEHTNINYIKKQTQKINEVGGVATLQTYDNSWNHTNVGTWTFSEKVKAEDGSMVNIVDAAFQYKRRSAKSKSDKKKS